MTGPVSAPSVVSAATDKPLPNRRPFGKTGRRLIAATSSVPTSMLWGTASISLNWATSASGSASAGHRSRWHSTPTVLPYSLILTSPRPGSVPACTVT